MGDDIKVVGKKPRSATAHHGPSSASSKNFQYVTMMPYSDVEESPFKSCHSALWHAPVTFCATWNKQKHEDKQINGTGRRDPPLLWCPNPKIKKGDSMSKLTTSHQVSTIKGIPMKHQFRRLKHTQTFVDETLFGEPLGQPSFRAPWEEKNNSNKPLLWYPDQTKAEKTQNCSSPKASMELRRHAQPSSCAFPVWRP